MSDKIEEKKEKRVPTKEEMANWFNEYYDWLESIYPVKNFEIPGRNEEPLYFYHGYNDRILDKDKPQCLVYFLRDNEFQEYEEKRVELNRKGEDPEEEKKFKVKATIMIDREKKQFSFLVDWDHQRQGYGRAIYNNYLSILEKLGIEDREQYELRISQNPEHEFLQNMKKEEFIAKTNGEPNLDNASEILKEFASYPTKFTLNELNIIMEYSIRSNVPMEKMAEAINQNGLNLACMKYDGVPQFEKEDMEKFQSFGITGIKPSCMHHHFMEDRNFAFMQFITEPETEDTTLEFRKVLADVKKKREEEEKKEEERRYIPENLTRYGELEHIILDWQYAGMFFKNLNPEVKAIIKEQAIRSFEAFDPEHRERRGLNEIDGNSLTTYRVLRDADMLDKDAYIALYQKALNRNYNLTEFDSDIKRKIDSKEREEARREIAKYIYCPYPEKGWQKTSTWGDDHRIQKVEIPNRVSKKDNIREIIKQEILRQGIAAKTRIKTDMMGVDKKGNPFEVNNLKDWMFGVPGARGNLQMMGKLAVTFPPQTPKIAMELIEKAFQELEYPDMGER